MEEGGEWVQEDKGGSEKGREEERECERETEVESDKDRQVTKTDRHREEQARRDKGGEE